MRIAVTGGTGFVGAALIDRLLREGASVSALVRNPSLYQPPGDVKIIAGDLDNQDALTSLADGAELFVHLAGLTHARKVAEYRHVNTIGAANAARAAADQGAQFVHVSSLSARAPHISPYAQSKYESESAIAAASGANAWLTLRLPAIYGPGDYATLPYFKLVKAGFALEPMTQTPARASLLYVDDAADAILNAARDAAKGMVYEVGDQRVTGYSWAEISAALAEALGAKTRRLRAPKALVGAYYGCFRALAMAFGRNPSVRQGQVNELFHPDWVAKDNLLTKATGWAPQTTIQEGFAKTVFWYQKNGLL